MNLIKKHTPIFLRKITPLFRLRQDTTARQVRGEFCRFPLVSPDKCHSHESGNPVEIKDCGFQIKLGTRTEEITFTIHQLADETQKEYDALRTAIINKLGMRVKRFRNEDIMHSIDKVIRDLKKIITSPIISPSFLKRRGQGMS